MRWRPQRLQLRLSLLFVGLLLGVSGLYGWLLYRAADDYVAEEMQRINHSLAGSIAKALRINERTNELSAAAIRRTFDQAMVINPRIKLYFIGFDGALLASSAKPGKIRITRVPTAPIKTFLAGRAPLPIWGVDPCLPETPTPFSAVLLRNAAGAPYCYLYITLDTRPAAGEPDAQRQSYLLRVLLRTLLVAAGSVLIIGLLLISLLTRNLDRLSAAVRRLQTGDYATRVTDIQPGDELGELAAAFNAMAARTQQAITALENTDALRRELLANVSHDLRTPLASIEGYAETILLRQPHLTDDERQRYLHIILNNTRSLKQLVTELFELSKLEARQTVPKPEPFAVAELVQDVLLQLRPRAEERTVRLSARTAPDLPFACADVSMVERVLHNLLENAIRYTPAAGQVRVEVRVQDAAWLHVEICDTGQGIAPDDLPHVFDRFYRSNQGRPQPQEGLGLGLAIARKMVELHGSTLRVTSTEGEGTCFAFELPVYQPR